eukprot:TRINITY_DN22694_c0_g1_i1.p1 TRINITY_DN22694_c0_g1~~TRINITY_DN22694_c0_g1_i1.p1  ORF type:complete len:849 (+),score=95.20 TRINITY_DN22694_c0_g1_i1:99-2549(+)
MNAALEEVNGGKQHATAILACAARGGAPEIVHYCAANLVDLSLADVASAMQEISRCIEAGGDNVMSQASFFSLRTHAAALLRGRPNSESGLPSELNDWTRCLSTIAWAHGALRLNDEAGKETMRLICNQASSHIQLFGLPELTDLLGSCAKFGSCQCEMLFKVAAHSITEKLNDVTFDMLCTIVWSYASLWSDRYRDFIGTLLRTCVGKLQSNLPNSPSPGHVVKLWLGLVRGNVLINHINLAPVISFVTESLHMYQAHEFATTCWSISRLGIAADGLFLRACVLLRDSRAICDNLTALAVVNLTWALATQLSLGSGIGADLMSTPNHIAQVYTRLMPFLDLESYGCLLRSLAQLGVRSGSNSHLEQVFVSATYCDIQHIQTCAVFIEALSLFSEGYATPAASLCAAFRDKLVEQCILSVERKWPQEVDGVVLRHLHAVAVSLQNVPAGYRLLLSVKPKLVEFDSRTMYAQQGFEASSQEDRNQRPLPTEHAPYRGHVYSESGCFQQHVSLHQAPPYFNAESRCVDDSKWSHVPESQGKACDSKRRHSVPHCHQNHETIAAGIGVSAAVQSLPISRFLGETPYAFRDDSFDLVKPNVGKLAEPLALKRGWVAPRRGRQSDAPMPLAPAVNADGGNEDERSLWKCERMDRDVFDRMSCSTFAGSDHSCEPDVASSDAPDSPSYGPSSFSGAEWSFDVDVSAAGPRQYSGNDMKQQRQRQRQRWQQCQSQQQVGRNRKEQTKAQPMSSHCSEFPGRQLSISQFVNASGGTGDNAFAMSCKPDVTKLAKPLAESRGWVPPRRGQRCGGGGDDAPASLLA